MKSVCLLLASAVLAFPLCADETPWQEVSPGVQMRLVTSDVLDPDGTTWAALEIDMPEDTKTYWRIPGESGIPPHFDIAQGRGVAGHEIAWPFPMRETDKGYLDHVYYGHLVLPFSLNLDRSDPVFQATITLGICSDVCVPVSVDIEHALDFDDPDTAQDFRIRQALAQVPVPWQEGPEPFGRAYHTPGSNTVEVELTDPDLPLPDVIVDVKGEPFLFGVPEPGAHARSVAVPVYGNVPSERLEGRDLMFTFMTRDGPFELTRRIEPQ